MNRYSKLTAVAAAALLAAPAFAAMTTDANLELDSTYGNLSRGATQGGRVEFNVAGKAGDANGFVAGRGTLLIQKTGGTATDDMWGQIGTGMADVKLGRFEAADMFPAGKDVLVEGGAEATGGYHAQTLRGRMGGDLFHAAITVNPGSGVGIEIGIVESKGAGNTKGIRPVVSFAAGPVSVKLAIESGQTNASSTGYVLDSATGLVTPPTATPARKFSGFGATVGGAFEGVGFNVSLASGKKKSNAVFAETKATSFGANATFGPAGVGLVSDSEKTSGVKSSDLVIYAAYSIPLFNTGATLTPAVSHQTGKVGGVSNKSATSVRARLNYTF
jgi:Porin-like glycoporin RafY